MTTKASTSRSWYDYPEFYDLAFSDDNEMEADFLQAVFNRFGLKKTKRVLEPGCGSGRLVVEMAKRGYSMTGLDLNENMLAYAAKRLKRDGQKARLDRCDMTDFKYAAPFDAAYNLINTFRHLLTEEQAEKHLRCVAQHLKPGGIFVLGFHLLPPDADTECTERWRASEGNTSVHFTLRVLEASRKQRFENMRLSMLARRGDETIRLRDEFRLRIYNATQAESLFSKIKELELIETFDFWYDIDEPQAFDDDISDAVFVFLRK